jgi:hypothetical protein
MRKTYNTPAYTTVSVCTRQVLVASQNEYYDDQGRIRFNSKEVRADDAD